MSTATTTTSPGPVASTERHTDDQDRLHRTDGPALVHASGTREWWQHGLLHRTDGPAIEYADGRLAHWVHGRRTT